MNSLFTGVQGTECRLACYQNYFHYHNIPLSEALMYFSGKGFQTVYRRDTEGANKQCNLTSDVNGAIRTFCGKYGINIHQSVQKLEQFKQELSRAIQINNPVILKVDAGSLKYHRAFSNSKGVEHYFLIIQMDDSGVYISDGYVPSTPNTTYEGWISWSDLQHSIDTGNVQYVEIDATSLASFRVVWNAEWEMSELYQSVMDAVDDYLIGGFAAEEGIYYGISALEQYTDDMSHFTDWFAGDYTGKMLEQQNILKNWGFLTGRKLLLIALKLLKNTLPFLEPHLRILEQTDAEWKNVNMYLVKAALSKRESDLLLIQNKIVNLAAKETHVLMELQKGRVEGIYAGNKIISS
ncbi:hypothetical protein GCM10010912_59700 [Paenibacillus albidus]|uniref:Butirosin biosynthesis protein H N-terminal domain-containing protein n=1 Tax=Paenibacillus albidus TaxID=2041023 RepID=A0A917FTH7_9BACL|nr:BtrH N-terminal domain-containing protein [Paenibacillus albidus]GGG07092.1 hypothetical protein GCM10010912_59700 [Paenibacillus albidus]